MAEPDLDRRLRQVAVVGAAGKMGSGIALLLARELAWRALEQPAESFILNLVDLDDAALQNLVRYLRAQAVKEAEKQINRLRALFQDRADLVDNQDMVQEFGFELLLRLRTGRTLALARDAALVFEAAFEDEALKTSLFRELAGQCRPDAWFFSNTSSIPVQGLAQACGLQGRLVGFHFYNPPAVQKLVELILPEDCDPDLARSAAELARLLGKRTVPSRDVAGFIGNGHFIREGLHAIRLLEQLAPDHGFVPALCLLDRVYRDFLLRPMGIFQLMDYVGLDVFQAITGVMGRHLGEELDAPLIDRCLALGIKGGQGPGGVQKPGFLDYRKGRPAAGYDPERRDYLPLDDGLARQVETALGALPDPSLSWKSLQQDPAREAKLTAHFRALGGLDTLGGTLARTCLQASREIALGLVQRGVARTAEDVNDVLKLGFFHLYGAVNDFLESP